MAVMFLLSAAAMAIMLLLSAAAMVAAFLLSAAAMAAALLLSSDAFMSFHSKATLTMPTIFLGITIIFPRHPPVNQNKELHL
ncbi:MAG: hypothetical protein LUE16_08595 [Lachnospiraceae bacterium]|nr:hypothetical protein [Lachnospiraceae bacterium]